MADISAIKLPNNVIYNIKDDFARNNLCVIMGTQTEETGQWTGNAPFNSLEDGQRILYFLPYQGTGNTTLNLTLADGTTTGAINCYMYGTSLLETQYGAGNFISMIYKENLNFNNNNTEYTGWWVEAERDIDANTTSLLSNVCVKAGTKGIFGNQLVMRTGEDTWESITSVRSINTNKTKNTSGFYLDSILYYNTETAVSSESMTRNWVFNTLYSSIDFRYSSNCGNTLVSNKPVYLVGTINNGKFYLDDNWYTQVLPNSEDNKVYIYLGESYSNYQICLTSSHPIFEYKNGELRLYGTSDTTYTAGNGLTLSSNNELSLSGYVHTAYGSNLNKYVKIAKIELGAGTLNIMEFTFSHVYASNTEPYNPLVPTRAAINFRANSEPVITVFGGANNIWIDRDSNSNTYYLYTNKTSSVTPIVIHDFYIPHWTFSNNYNPAITWLSESVDSLPEGAIQATFGYNVGYINGHTVESNVPSNAIFTDTTYTLSEGNSNGQIKITPSSGDAYNINVKGLGTSAYKNTTDTYSSTGTDPITGTGVAAALATLPEPMVFKGSLGTGGTITSLPTASSINKGFTYKVITDGTYAGLSAKAGDTFISDGSNWVLIPSGDEPSGTVTSITINATSPIAIDNNNAITTSGTRTISHANSGATAGSYGDNSNQTPTYGSTFKVPYITVNETGHVTGVSEHTVKIPNSDNTDTKVSTILENPTTGTYYCIPFTKTAESTEELKINNGLRGYSLEGTAESLGIGGLALGNHIPSETEGNKQGHLYFYTSGVNYSDLYQSDLTTNITHLLPNVGGTLLNTGNFSYSPTVTTSDINSYKIGSIIINGTSTDIYGKDNNTTYSVVNKASNGLCPQLPNEITTTKYLRQDGTWVAPPNTDTKVSTVLLNPESETTYYLPFKAASESTDILNSNNGLRYSTKEGTDSVDGLGELFLGNRIATGTAGNKEGVLFLYSNNIGGSYLKQDTITGNNITHTLPSTGGTLLNTGTTSYTQVISSNTTGAYKIGSIKVNNTTTDIYGKDTTYSTGTSSVAGLAKLYTGIGTATDGTMTQNAIKTALESKADSAHTHSYVTDIADGTVTSFGYSKAVLSEDDYTYLAGWVELEGGGYQLRDIPKSRFATASHTHNYAGSDSEGGAANSLKYFKNTSTTDVGVDDTTANAIGYVSGLTQASWNNRHTYGALYKQIYDSSWGHEIFGDYYNGHLAVRGKTNSGWSDWSAVLDSSNYSDYSNLKQIAKQNIGNSSSSISFTISGNFHNNSSSGEISVISSLTFKVKGVYLNSETTNPVSGTLDLCGFVGSSYSRSVWNVMATTLYAGTSFSEASSNSTFFRANGIRDLAYVTVSHDLTSSNSTGTVTVTFNNFQSAGGIVSLDYDSSVYTVS